MSTISNACSRKKLRCNGRLEVRNIELICEQNLEEFCVSQTFACLCFVTTDNTVTFRYIWSKLFGTNLSMIPYRYILPPFHIQPVSPYEITSRANRVTDIRPYETGNLSLHCFCAFTLFNFRHIMPQAQDALNLWRVTDITACFRTVVDVPNKSYMAELAPRIEQKKITFCVLLTVELSTSHFSDPIEGQTFWRDDRSSYSSSIRGRPVEGLVVGMQKIGLGSDQGQDGLAHPPGVKTFLDMNVNQTLFPALIWSYFSPDRTCLL